MCAAWSRQQFVMRRISDGFCCRCLFNEWSSSTLLPLCSQKAYCWRYQYRDVTIWTNMLIQFGLFRPFISWTATLPPVGPTSVTLKELRSASVWIHNSGFRPASSNTQLASRITERFYGNVGDTNEEFDWGELLFRSWLRAITADFWLVLDQLVPG